MYMRIMQRAVLSSASNRAAPFSCRFYSTKASKPLRILFCGSDDFSSASLRALHAEQKRDSQLIRSIDVLCRPGKPYGRSLKTIRDVPIKAVAQELGLSIHERDTFTGWELPQPEGEAINLIVAVSFGLFVPPRILKSAEYGGLNIHPSLLPNFRGPAPLQHTLMTATRFTGVTLQTLHEKSFDHGTILAQTPKNGLAIPFPYQCTHKDLLEFITPKAAEMLVQGIKDKVFVPPLEDVGWYHSTNIHRAPKITSQDRQIDWKSWPSLKVERYHRAIGRLWNNIQFEPNTVKRVIFEDIEVIEMPEVLVEWSAKAREYPEGKIEEENDFKAVRFMVYLSPNNDRIPQFYVADGDAIIIAAPGPSSDLASSQAVRVKEITVDGQGKQAASKIMARIHDRKMWQLMKRGSTSFWVNPEQPRTRKI